MVDLYLKDLAQFVGTKNYYNYFGVLITDGVKYITENGYNWFVVDTIAEIKTNKKLKKEFLTIELKVDAKNNKAEIIFSDGNKNILETKKYNYTDAKVDLKLFYVDNILLLSQEY